MATALNKFGPASTSATTGRRTSAIEVKSDRIVHATRAPLAFTDPAEYFDFARPTVSGAARFDNRTDAELKRDLFAAPTPLERERAVWELADRLGEEAQPVIVDFLAAEPDRKARAHALWLLQRTGGAAVERLTGYFGDDDPEVADWSRLLVEELTGRPIGTVYTKLSVHEDRTFDQTLPLLIAGYALVNVPFLGRLSVTLSPLWFESILGRVMACTNHRTFMTDLVIEKELFGVHPDGTAHYEIFNFKGFSFPISPSVTEHHYESMMMRPFYPSGTVEDGTSIRVPIPLARVAGTEVGQLCPAASAGLPTMTLIGEGPRADLIRDEGYVRNVRGRYFGWAAANVASLHVHGTVRPGAVQLSNPSHPVAGPMTNTILFGTFRGKIADHDGDGALDINTIPCHGTAEGDHDLHCDGSAVEDPFLR